MRSNFGEKEKNATNSLTRSDNSYRSRSRTELSVGPKDSHEQSSETPCTRSVGETILGAMRKISSQRTTIFHNRMSPFVRTLFVRSRNSKVSTRVDKLLNWIQLLIWLCDVSSFASSLMILTYIISKIDHSLQVNQV